MNKYYGAFLFFILIISTSHAQDFLTDSLQSVYSKAATDSAKAQALIAIAKHEWVDLNDGNTAIGHLNTVLAMPNQKVLVEAETAAKLWLGMIYSAQRFNNRNTPLAYLLTQQALLVARENGFRALETDLLISLSNQLPDKTDSVKLLMAQAKDIATTYQLKEQQISALRRLGIFYATIKFEDSKSYFFQALGYARQYHLPRQEIAVLRNLANTYSLAHLTDSSNDLYQMAIKIAREQQLVDQEISMLRTTISTESGFFIKDSLVANYNRLIWLSRRYNKDSLGTMARFAQTCTDLGDYPRALKASLILLHAEEEKKDSVRVEGDLYQIGLEYEGTKDYQRALEYLYKAKTYGSKDPFTHIFIHDDLAKTYLLIKNKDSARYYADKSYQLAVEFYGSEANVYGGVLNDLGDIYFQLGNDSLAIDHLRRSYIYFTTANIEYQNYCATTIGLAKYFKKAGLADSSNYYARLCLTIARDKGFLPIVTEASGLIADYFRNKHNPDSAYYYQQIGFEAYKTLFSDESNRQFQNMTFAEQQRIQDIANEKKIAADQYKSKLQLYGLLTVLLVSVIIGAIIYRNNRQKQKSYNLLKMQKQEIDKQKSKLEVSIKELQSTQSQLIQSEKMASLGELTAGIAHEIQNPLNFVNNFSEVNMELLAEMNTAIREGKYEDAVNIAKDVTENQEKINHHGKRADAIVKGMLQHSRSGNGATETTNINELADEYLRLSYHGLRARDKNFNAEIKKDYDESIGNIPIIPQDIGRVLLNLYNNAFYAVTEKKKQWGSAYQPVVTVSSKKINGTVEIRIKDNGNGIPQKIVDKIFQPFFTTKPTGEGTGLGLSLSYDIIKAHRGEIKVETTEGKGTEFILHLPI